MRQETQVAVDPKALAKEARTRQKEEHAAREMGAYGPLDRWYGVEGISAPLGHPRFMTDDSLERLARTYRRHLEDERDGLGGSVPDLTNEQVTQNLREIEGERGIRETLRYAYGAAEAPRGTQDRLTFLDAGGLAMLAEAERTGQEPLIRPSYKLALFLDYARWLEGLLTALDWSQAAPKGDPLARWAGEAWRRERAAYMALMDAALGDWEVNEGHYAWIDLEALDEKGRR